MMIFEKSGLRRACSLKLDEGLLPQSCPARQDPLSASVDTLFFDSLYKFQPANILVLSYKIVQFWPSQVV